MFLTQFFGGGHGLILKGSNEVTWSQMYEAKKALVQDACCSVTFAIIDFEEVTQLHVSHEQIRELVHLDRILAKQNPDAVIAVAAPKDHVFGLCRMWQSLVEDIGWKTALFRSREEALSWGARIVETRRADGGTTEQAHRPLSHS